MRMTDPMKGVFRGLDIAAAGLRAELQRSEVVASNLSNMHRTGNATREPYRRRAVKFEELIETATTKGAGGDRGARAAAGVGRGRIVEDTSDFPIFYQPGHPDADESGRVLGSNVDLFQELVDMQSIERSFDANLAAMRSYRTMLQKTIDNMSR